MEPILAIVGPTASGKTSWALQLAREQHGELISVDSRQVYKKLSVGTAKPEGRWSDGRFLVEGVPYHLLDTIDPAEPFSAARFVEDASQKILEIRSRKRTPILVGGTGLYFKALTDGLAPLPPADPALRAELRERADRIGREALHSELKAVDPKAAAKIPANNIARLIRALEVFKLTGKPLSQWHQEHQTRAPVERVRLRYRGIELPLDELHRRIEARCRAMLEFGMIEETQNLLRAGYAETSPALSGLGYPRVIAFLKGLITKDELATLLFQDTRQYAKRQRTWFRNQMKVEWKTL